jgi:hypothetical protein
LNVCIIAQVRTMSIVRTNACMLTQLWAQLSKSTMYTAQSRRPQAFHQTVYAHAHIKKSPALKMVQWKEASNACR